jgi:hypothetical protein
VQLLAIVSPFGQSTTDPPFPVEVVEVVFAGGGVVQLLASVFPLGQSAIDPPFPVDTVDVLHGWPVVELYPDDEIQPAGNDTVATEVLHG